MTTPEAKTGAGHGGQLRQSRRTTDHLAVAEAVPHEQVVDLAGATTALRHGRAVVLPNPDPLTHVVAATQPRRVNAAKGRPETQPTALWAHHPKTLDALTGPVGLTPSAMTLVRRLLTEELLTVLVPLSVGMPAPAWLAPAQVDGWAILFGASWTPLRPLLRPFPILYVSSANRTGQPPASCTDQALSMFTPSTHVLDLPGLAAGHPPGKAAPRATTTVRVRPNGQLSVYRHGAQDCAHSSPGQYLHHLERTYRP